MLSRSSQCKAAPKRMLEARWTDDFRTNRSHYGYKNHVFVEASATSWCGAHQVSGAAMHDSKVLGSWGQHGLVAYGLQR